MEEVIEIALGRSGQKTYTQEDPESIKDLENDSDRVDELLFKTFLILIKEIDYSNKEINQSIAQLFYNNIVVFNAFWEDDLCEKGFSDILIIRIFSIWILRYLFNNLVLQEKDINISSASKLRSAARVMLKELFFEQSDEEIEQLLIIVTKFTARAIGFIDEILSNKWNTAPITAILIAERKPLHKE